MNGRIYDPLLGRFLSADPILQFPTDLQSYNRYSYVRNNPLTATDSSGAAEDTYSTMTDDAASQYSSGHPVAAFFTVLGQQAFNMASLGTFRSNSAVAGQVGVNQMSVGEGAARMTANTAIAATAATAAVVTGGASAAAVGGSGFVAGAVGGAVGGFSAGAVQTGGDTAIAASTGGSTPTIGDNLKQIASSTVSGAVAGAAIGGAAALDAAAPKAGLQSEVDSATQPTQVKDGKSPGIQLSSEQSKNVARFEKNLPGSPGPTTLRSLPNQGVAAQATVPGKVPGSSATYEKQIDSSGKTLQFTKTTVNPAGDIVHVKDKISGTQLPENSQ